MTAGSIFLAANLLLRIAADRRVHRNATAKTPEASN
jgi:hypothetical protein